MTALVSRGCPFLSHICPEVRIIAGIDASMITSEGTCKLVVPFSLLTMAKSDLFSIVVARAASISLRWSVGRVAIFAYTSPNPLHTSTPNFLKVSPYFSNTSAK